MNSFNIHTSAAISILAMVVVTVFMDWVPTALNRNIRGMTVRERLRSTIIHSTVGLLLVAANIFGFRWGILLGALWYSIVLLAAIRNWWIPYFFGIHQGEITPELFARHYAQNVIVLPRFNDNPVIPDVQHMLIHLAVVCAAVLSWSSYWHAR